MAQDNQELKSGFSKAKKITADFAKTFYFASLFLPIEKQNAAYAVYAICRLSDEAVDTQTNTGALENMQKNIDQAYAGCLLQKPADPLLLAFAEIVNKFAIPKEYFDELIKGMRMDLKKTRYADFDELYDYCYKAAGVVGLIMLKIFGYSDPEAQAYAIKLGIAMQLTNIIRDIKEDWQKGRIYLPQTEMQKFAITEDTLKKTTPTPDFIKLLKFQIKRSRQYYSDCTPGIAMLKDKNCRRVVLAMKEIYAAILNKVEKNSYNVLLKRAQVSKLDKIMIVSKILIKGNCS
ncbi:MAG: phytoene/squalene synthase family protein [Candidatus Omnitrophica bacterium]|jgi:phytoene synthase|nr:phytoene/squalene synthase family protein [Candidatus Omnitrophota bacterium]